MPALRPFRFLAEAGAISDGRALADAARRAEASGIDVLVIPDHLIDQLGPIPALATAATATERLRIGTFVFNNDLRHPAVLAQDLASHDVLSGGRLEIGIGAGWNEPEYRAIGLPFDPVGTRVARLAESIAVLKGSFGPGSFSFVGKHYTITDFDGRPKPIQRPHPPFFVGGGGRRLLSQRGARPRSSGLRHASCRAPGATRGASRSRRPRRRSAGYARRPATGSNSSSSTPTPRSARSSSPTSRAGRSGSSLAGSRRGPGSRSAPTTCSNRRTSSSGRSSS